MTVVWVVAGFAIFALAFVVARKILDELERLPTRGVAGQEPERSDEQTPPTPES